MGDNVMGGIYKRSDSKNYWMFYKDGAGRTVAESTKVSTKTAARELLRQREAQVTDHRFAGLKAEKTTFSELGERIIRDYKINKRKSLPTMINMVERLKKYFGPDTKAT